MSPGARMPVVCITGCSSGIGHALAQSFRARGCTVIATARQLSALATLEEQGIHTFALDVNDAASVSALLEQLRAQNLAVDILVNNAGYGQMGPLLDVDEAVLQQQFETNVVGLMRITRALLPDMIARAHGLIVNIGSVSGVLVTPFAGAYCASKAAVHALSDALRMEVAPLGIKVMVVQPGAIASEFGRAAQQQLRLRHDSPYQKIADGVAARAVASQQNATPAAELAQRIVDAALSARPPMLLRAGHGSSALPWMARWVPQKLRDRILSAKFGLTRL
nr:SDR family oxidoreductase [Sinimarinibacterium sp. NLF-5-8]